MVIAMSIISVIIAVGVPIALGVFTTKRFKISWNVIFYGAMAFIVAYFINLFLSNLLSTAIDSGSYPWMNTGWFTILYPVLIGLLTGLLEQGANWLAFKFAGDMGKSWGSALGLGLGHGGMESIYAVGIPLLLTIFQVLNLKANGIASLNLPATEAAAVQESLDSFFATPWHLPLAIGLDRLFALVIQIAAAVLTWLAFRKRGWYWFAAAVGLQMLSVTAGLLLGSLGSTVWIAEGVILIIAAASAYILYQVKTRIIDKSPELLEVPVVSEKAPVKPVLEAKSKPVTPKLVASKPAALKAPKPTKVLTKKSTSRKPVAKKK